MDYETLLKNAPAHDTPEFIEYLRKNNRVHAEGIDWLVVENYKYHTQAKPWYTAFLKTPIEDANIKWLNTLYGHLTWLKKSPDKQTVKRFHIHMYQE